ncbi:MAG: LysM peptidoglycan-binding domain-containing protein [Bdellovibrio sp.]
MPSQFFNLFPRMLFCLTLAWMPFAYSQSVMLNLEEENIVDDGIDAQVKDPCQLRLDMQHVWMDHVALTHFVIISTAKRLPDAKVNMNRLLKNQEEIGAVFKTYYGATKANRLTTLLKEHINIAGQLIVAVRDGHLFEARRLGNLWLANGDTIATFLNSLNSKNWPLATVKAMFRQHLTLTGNEANAYLQGNYAQSISYYDQVHNQIMKMAEMLANGIIQQFP